MNPEKRTAIIRLVLGLGTLAMVGLLWPNLRGLDLMSWLVLGSLTVLVALVQTLGIQTSYGQITFLPVAALMAYMALGREAALAASTAGLLISGVGQLVWGWRRPQNRQTPWWIRFGSELWPIAHNGLSLLAADWAYLSLGSVPPLESVTAWSQTLPIVSALFIYLLVYDFLIVGGLALRAIPIVPTLVQYRRPLLAVQILPLPLAPFGAVAGAQVGVVAFFLFEIILLTIVVVVNRLSITQDTLQDQVRRLSSLSAMNRAMRTSLEVESLYQTLYLQIANLLQIKNLHVFRRLGDDTSEWKCVFAVEGGHRVKRDEGFEMDDLTAWVLKQRLPMLAEPVEEVGRRLQLTRLPRARSWMGVPMLASNHVMGCLVTWLGPDEQPERVLNQVDLDTFTAIAVQAEAAMENAQLYEAARQHAAQLARLNQISAVVNASLNPERVLELVAESVIEVAGCDRAAIYLLEMDSEDPTLLLTHAQGFSPEHIARSRDIAVPLSDEERHRVIEEGRYVIMPDLHAPGAPVPPAMLLLAEREKFSAYAYFPLSAQKRPIGMLAVYYDQPHPFSEGEIELLATFANQTALAVTNARIYQRTDIQLTRRVEQIVRMADISRRLSSTLELEQVFNEIINSALEGCKADAGVLVLSEDLEYGGGRSEPNMVAWRGFDPASSVRAPHIVAEEFARSRVIENGETMLVSIDDPSTPGPCSRLGVPIFLEGRVIGGIVLESESLNAFTEEDITFVSQLAVQAAVAIRNAQLYQRAQIVRDRLHAILDASDDGLLMIDAKSRIVMTNTRMGDFWDFARQDFSPRSPDQFLADPLAALGEGLGYREGELSALLKRGIRNPNLEPQTDLYVTHPSGGQRARFVERTATPVRDERGNFIGLLLVFRDVTQQKELEQARQDLTSMIVHDLRAPLQTVMGGLRLIETRLPAEDAVSKQATEYGTRAAKKVLNLVNNLLDLSKLEGGEFVPDTSPGSVRDVLETAVQEMTPLAQEMEVVLHTDIAPDLPYGQMDQDMIGRAVLNLLDNAMKYSKSGSLVTLRAKVASFDGRDMIHVQVIDNGQGVPDQYKKAIFDRFSQIPGREGRRRGTGLGLAFCRMAVESHGGKIWVEDNPDGGGSIFAFTLPISRIQPQAKEGGDGEKKAADTAASAQPAQPSAPPQSKRKPAPPEPDGKSVVSQPPEEGRPEKPSSAQDTSEKQPSSD